MSAAHITRLIACCFLGVFIARSGLAQVVFQPDILMLELNHKDQVAARVLVRNMGPEAKDITIGVEYRRPGPCRRPAGDWVSVYPGHFRLAKGEAKTIQVQLNGTEQAAAGECVLSLYAGEWVQGQISLNLKTGMPLFVRLNREKKVQGRLIRMEGQVLPSGNILVTAWVENTGAVHLLPYGLSWISNKRGGNRDQTEFRAGQPVFPGEKKAVQWEIKPAERRRDDTLGIRLFWGTAYGMRDIPKSTEVSVPFKKLLKKKE